MTGTCGVCFHDYRGPAYGNIDYGNRLERQKLKEKTLEILT